MAELAHAANNVRLVISTKELKDRVNNLFHDKRPGVAIHISQHVVAQKRLNTGYNKCFLSEDARGTRRFYLPGDVIHESRIPNPQTMPSINDIPENYRYLHDWYLESIGNYGNDSPAIEIAVNGENNSDRINDLIEHFPLYLDYFTNNIKFSGPSVYFHQKTINKIRTTQDYNVLLGDTHFLELVYATLVSWGMHTMGKNGPKMAEFDSFRISILRNRKTLTYLSQFRLESIPEESAKQIKNELKLLFKDLDVMASGSQIVGNSKVLHHLLPDLITPIDRTHTLKFFYGNTNIYRDELTIFLECFEKFQRIANLIKENDLELKGFNTSIPKIIDNAIMGYVMKNVK